MTPSIETWSAPPAATATAPPPPRMHRLPPHLVGDGPAKIHPSRLPHQISHGHGPVTRSVVLLLMGENGLQTTFPGFCGLQIKSHGHAGLQTKILTPAGLQIAFPGPHRASNNILCPPHDFKQNSMTTHVASNNIP